MNWAVLIPIIAQYGIPVAEALVQKWTSGSAPTQADFDNLKQLAASQASDEAKKVLTSLNIPLTDPRAISLLALVG